MIPMARCLLFVAIAMLLSTICLAKITNTSVIGQKGVSAMQLTDDGFGLAQGGYINFDVDIGTRDALQDRAFIVVFGESTTKEWYLSLTDDNDVDNNEDPALCAAPSNGRFQILKTGSFNMSVVQPDVYSAYLLVCNKEANFGGIFSSTFVNLDPEGGLTQHLPIESAMLPALHSLISVAYMGLVVAWIGEMARLRPHVLPVHILGLLCVWTKTNESIMRAIYFHRQSKEGQNQRSLLLTVTMLESLFQVLFLLALLLLSLGWGFIRRHLRSKEGWLVSITVGFYAGISLLNCVCQDVDSNSCSGVALMEYAIRSLLMLTTVVAINFNITHIRFCIQFPWTSSSALEYLKLSRYLSFRMIFLAYLLLPSALLVVRITVLSWEYSWVNNALNEFIILLILAFLGTTFAPLDPWLLTRAFDHSLEQQTS